MTPREEIRNLRSYIVSQRLVIEGLERTVNNLEADIKHLKKYLDGG